MTDFLACYHSFPGWDGTLRDAPFVVWNLILADFGIFVAYIAISWGLYRYVVSRTDVPFPEVALLFALFIHFCGWTHLLKIVVLFLPAFWAEAAIAWLTFSLSVVAAVVWQMKYRGLLDHHVAIEALKSGIAKKQDELLRKIEKLEKEVP